MSHSVLLRLLVPELLASFFLLQPGFEPQQAGIPFIAKRPDPLLKLAKRLGVDKELVAVENVRGGISKTSMIHNDACPLIEVDPETYRVTADGELLVCEPAKSLPMAQRYFMF